MTNYLNSKYASAGAVDDDDEGSQPFGASKESVIGWIEDAAETIREAQHSLDLKKVKEVDKRLKGCTNPEKVPGSALSVLFPDLKARKLMRSGT